MRCSGVNPTDWKQRQGPPGAGPLGEFSFLVPNQDGAGDIDGVGQGVDAGRVGERVWVYFAARNRQFGSAAEYLVLPAEQAVPLPEGASYELGASLGIPALTAHRCLFADGPISGRTVLVAGGAGAVGHFAIELAKWKGAQAIATVSGEAKADLARRAGADVVVNYREPDVAGRVHAAAPEGVQRVVEVALGANLALDTSVLVPNGAIATYASDAIDPTLTVSALMRRNTVLRFVMIYTVPPPALAMAIEEVNAALGDGALSELPMLHFPLDEAAAAHQAVEDGAVGKVVIDL